MIRVTRVYSDKNGESHFEDIELPLRNEGDIGFSQQEFPLKN